MNAKRISSGHYKYKGWEIEKIEDAKHWNMRPIGTAFWTDAAQTKSEAMKMIDRWEAPEKVKFFDLLDPTTHHIAF